jgi:uncharacterized coiled-coil protein SlyX
MSALSIPHNLGIRRGHLSREGGVIEMALHIGHEGASLMAGGVGLCSAVVAQVAQDSNPPVATGAMALGFASVVAAAGPHLIGSLKEWMADRRHAREMAVVDLANRYAADHARVLQLERLAATAPALEAKAREIEARYAESQEELDELRRVITDLIQPVSENQDDLRRIAATWQTSTPPALSAITAPAPIPAPPASRGSSDRIVIPPEIAHPKPKLATEGPKP